MRPLIIGTAGHIDHGKTALIRALTGRSTDRLKEERERGISIELGFTWFDMDDGTRCGIIDVPGHEKFIGTMVSGVVGMDLVLMVVAADEGVMPQTREHLDILELLGITRTILVLNKCDLVDEEWLDMVEEETREALKGTIMEHAPCVRVSSVTGEGIPGLKALILEMAEGSGMTGRAGKGEKAEKGERDEVGGKAEIGEKAEKGERTEIGEKAEIGGMTKRAGGNLEAVEPAGRAHNGAAGSTHGTAGSTHGAAGSTHGTAGSTHGVALSEGNGKQAGESRGADAGAGAGMARCGDPAQCGRDRHAPARLPVDRVFTVAGFGTVVTGTLISGMLATGDPIVLYPAGLDCRVRNLQVHGEDRESCTAGQRVAVNLAGVKKDEIRRGCVLASPGTLRASDRLDVKVRLLPHAGRFLTNRERLHLHTGSAEVLCRAVLLDSDGLAPGENGYAQLVLEEKIAAGRGDRFIIRFYSPVETIGGGVILDACPVRKKRFDGKALEELRRREAGSPADLCEFHIRAAGENMCSPQELAGLTGMEEDMLSQPLSGLVREGRVVEVPLRKETRYWHIDSLSAFQERLVLAVKQYHGRYPYRPGMPKPELHKSCMNTVKANVFEACLKLFADRGALTPEGEMVHLPGFSVIKDGNYLAMEGLVTDVLREAGFQLIRLEEIPSGAYPREVLEDVLREMSEEEQIVRICGDVCTLKEIADAAEAKVREHFSENGILTIQQLRDMLGTSRKCAKQFIEYLDAKQVTGRAGGETQRILL